MHRTPWGYRPETQSRHLYEAPGHGAYGRGSTCNYDVYSYHGQHARGHAEDKYDVYKKYSGDAPGGTRTWQRPQPEGAYGSYACNNQSQYAKHDGSAWLPTTPAKYGEQNAPDAQAASCGQYAKYDGSAQLCSKQNEEQAALHGLCYTETEGTGTKRLLETLATVGGRQGEGGQADEQDRRVKMRKLYDPGNVQPLDDYDIEDWGLE